MTWPAEREEPTTEALLGRLIQRGYRFVHPRDADGDIVTVVGIRAHGSVIDVVRIDGEDDVTALRMPGDEENVLEPRTVLWRSQGTMPAVVDEVLDLPDDAYAEPSEPGAAARGCWVPGGRGRAKWLMATA